MDTLKIELVSEEINRTLSLFRLVSQDKELIRLIAEAGEECASALRKGNKILIAGNGGSAADAQHIAAEFVSRLCTDRVPLAALALTTDSSILTACANDYGFEMVFERQLKALGKAGDVFIAISTSGNSKNIVRALDAARAAGLVTVVLTGKTGGELVDRGHYLLRVPSQRTQNIQEVHIMIGHTICAIAEQRFLKVESESKRVMSDGR